MLCMLHWKQHTKLTGKADVRVCSGFHSAARVSLFINSGSLVAVARWSSGPSTLVTLCWAVSTLHGRHGSLLYECVKGKSEWLQHWNGAISMQSIFNSFNTRWDWSVAVSCRRSWMFEKCIYRWASLEGMFMTNNIFVIGHNWFIYIRSHVRWSFLPFGISDCRRALRGAIRSKLGLRSMQQA